MLLSCDLQGELGSWTKALISKTDKQFFLLSKKSLNSCISFYPHITTIMETKNKISYFFPYASIVADHGPRINLDFNWLDHFLTL